MQVNAWCTKRKKKYYKLFYENLLACKLIDHKIVAKMGLKLEPHYTIALSYDKYIFYSRYIRESYEKW